VWRSSLPRAQQQPLTHQHQREAAYCHPAPGFALKMLDTVMATTGVNALT
jgi:hypothetical protein